MAHISCKIGYTYTISHGPEGSLLIASTFSDTSSCVSGNFSGWMPAEAKASTLALSLVSSIYIPSFAFSWVEKGCWGARDNFHLFPSFNHRPKRHTFRKFCISVRTRSFTKGIIVASFVGLWPDSTAAICTSFWYALLWAWDPRIGHHSETCSARDQQQKQHALQHPSRTKQVPTTENQGTCGCEQGKMRTHVCTWWSHSSPPCIGGSTPPLCVSHFLLFLLFPPRLFFALGSRNSRGSVLNPRAPRVPQRRDSNLHTLASPLGFPLSLGPRSFLCKLRVLLLLGAPLSFSTVLTSADFCCEVKTAQAVAALWCRYRPHTSPGFAIFGA